MESHKGFGGCSIGCSKVLLFFFLFDDFCKLQNFLSQVFWWSSRHITYQHRVVSRGQKEGHARTGRGAVSEQSRRTSPQKLWEVFNQSGSIFHCYVTSSLLEGNHLQFASFFSQKQRFHMISCGVFRRFHVGFHMISCGVFR